MIIEYRWKKLLEAISSDFEDGLYKINLEFHAAYRRPHSLIFSTKLKSVSRVAWIGRNKIILSYGLQRTE